MNDDQSTDNAGHYLTKLQERHEELIERIEGLREGLQSATGQYADEADESVALEAQRAGLVDLERNQLELRRVKQAIERLDCDFGMCSCCDHQIEPGRLELDPAVERCVSCQEIEEIHGRHHMPAMAM